MRRAAAGGSLRAGLIGLGSGAPEGTGWNDGSVIADIEARTAS